LFCVAAVGFILSSFVPRNYTCTHSQALGGRLLCSGVLYPDNSLSTINILDLICDPLHKPSHDIHRFPGRTTPFSPLPPFPSRREKQCKHLPTPPTPPHTHSITRVSIRPSVLIRSQPAGQHSQKSNSSSSSNNSRDQIGSDGIGSNGGQGILLRERRGVRWVGRRSDSGTATRDLVKDMILQAAAAEAIGVGVGTSSSTRTRRSAERVRVRVRVRSTMHASYPMRSHPTLPSAHSHSHSHSHSEEPHCPTESSNADTPHEMRTTCDAMRCDMSDRLEKKDMNKQYAGNVLSQSES
jgi:hypothetical protein